MDDYFKALAPRSPAPPATGDLVQLRISGDLENAAAACATAWVACGISLFVTAWKVFWTGACNGTPDAWELAQVAHARNILLGLVAAGVLVVGAGSWRFPRRAGSLVVAGGLMAVVPLLALLSHGSPADWHPGMCVGP